MNQVIVNAKGDPCPVPVVKATQALRSMTEPGRLVIYVDNEIAVQNLSRMAASHQFTAHAEKQGEDYVVTVEVTRAMSQGTAAPAQQEEADCIPDARGNTAVVLSGDCMGQGDDTLGRMLMKGFVFALTQLEELPRWVILYNGGAKLSQEGSDCLEDLRTLEAQGVEVWTCGACVNFYALPAPAVGQVTNMYSIAEMLTQAGKVIRP